MASDLKYLLAVLTIIISFKRLVAQSSEIDSLRTTLAHSKSDTTTVKILNELAFAMRFYNADTSLMMSRQALMLAQKSGWNKGEAMSFQKLGSISLAKEDYDQSLENYQSALKLWEKIEPPYGGESGLIITVNSGIAYKNKGDYKKALECYFKGIEINKALQLPDYNARIAGNIANVYCEQGSYPQALSFYFNLLEKKKELGEENVPVILGNIGNIYVKLKEYPQALDYYFRSLTLKEAAGNRREAATTLSNIGLTYYSMNDNTKALDYLLRALKLSEEINSKDGIAHSLSNLGNVYMSMGNFTRAIDHHLKALTLQEEMGADALISTGLYNIGVCYSRMREFRRAEDFLKRSILISESTGELYTLMEQHFELSMVYDSLRLPQLALKHYESFAALKDSIFNEDKSSEIGRLEAQHEFDKEQAVQQAEHKKELELIAQKEKRRSLLNFCFGGGSVMILLCAAFLFGRFRYTWKQKEIIEKQKEKVEEKQKEILDSIRYAKRIQSSLLTNEKYIQKNLHHLNAGQ
jgi:tetratricopeptide (TPR) repeat protein